MKVVHLVGGSLSGGAARGAYWLHRALRELGVDSRIVMAISEGSADEHVYGRPRTPLNRITRTLLRQLDQAPSRLYRRREQRIFSTGFFGHDLSKHVAVVDADIVHLHWVNGGFLQFSSLRSIKKPVVWTLRDMWPMTGGCHYAMDCTNYVSGCGSCPQLRSKGRYDLSRLVLARKSKNLPRDLTLVGISEWMSACARNSSIFDGKRIETIHNGIDTADFFPLEKSFARRALSLPEDRKIILVGAQNLEDFYKGFSIFIEAVNLLDPQKYIVLMFGAISAAATSKLNVPSRSVGFLSDVISLRLAYSAADVFVAPSLLEAFGKTLVEAMACGTPVVSFDSAGPRDIVNHRVNGFRATPYSPESLAQGISWVCGESGDRLSILARESANSRFSSSISALSYQSLYIDLLKKGCREQSKGLLK